ncbi:MAG TPA: ABC transporter substrate-binding protein [Burkholderiales bacterium]|nr:ABC transporter substrate-binding protein [Burkholderiales bacterium]
MKRRDLLKGAALGLGALAAPAIRPAMAQGGTIKIGVLNDQSALYADLGGQGSVIAARMAVEELGGRVGNTPVEVIFADHQNRADTGSSIARQWFDRDGVNMIADVPNSSVALAVNGVVRDKNGVFVASGPASADLTGRQCTPNTVHWTYDNWALANGTAKAIVQAGGRTWFFLTVDYAFGHDLEAQVAAVVRASGGEVLGAVRHPLNTQDFSSFLLQAQRSRANIIGLANAGGDTINSIKQASEFGIVKGGQSLAGMLVFISDVHALGLQTAQGLIFTETFYWDRNDASRAFAKRFAPQYKGSMPTMVQAGIYSAVLHYLKAIEAAKTDDGPKVAAKMKEMPTDDPLFGKGRIRADGRKIHDAYLVEVKKPSESKGPWDYYKIRAAIPAEQAFRPEKEGGCPLVK